MRLEGKPAAWGHRRLHRTRCRLASSRRRRQSASPPRDSGPQSGRAERGAGPCVSGRWSAAVRTDGLTDAQRYPPGSWRSTALVAAAWAGTSARSRYSRLVAGPRGRLLRYAGGRGGLSPGRGKNMGPAAGAPTSRASRAPRAPTPLAAVGHRCPRPEMPCQCHPFARCSLDPA